MFKKTHIKLLLGSILIGSMAAVSTTAMANEAMMDLLKVLRDKGSISQAEYEVLANAAKADAEKTEAMKAEVEEKVSSLPKIDVKGSGLKMKSADGKHWMGPRGRIMWDYIAEDDDGNTDIVGGGELRRARLGFQGQLYTNWKYRLEYDFAGSDADLKDGWLSYNDKFESGQKWHIKLGQHHVPFGFNTISSSNHMLFLRRPLFGDNTMSPARKLGAAFRVDDKRWFVHAGAYLDEPEDGAVAEDGSGDEEYYAAIRVAGQPYFKDKKHQLHIGASYMRVDNLENSFRVRQRAVTHLDDRSFNTNALTVDSANAFDLEAAGVWGSAHFLAEYVMWDLDNNTAGAAENLSAWSVEAGWFLTGESMNLRAGQFRSVTPNKRFIKDGGLGAWQVAVRYENMDLNDGTTTGGDGDILSVGLNWYPLKNVRFLATYNKVVDFEKPGDANDGLEPAALSVRSMVYW